MRALGRWRRAPTYSALAGVHGAQAPYRAIAAEAIAGLATPDDTTSSWPRPSATCCATGGSVRAGRADADRLRVHLALAGWPRRSDHCGVAALTCGGVRASNSLVEALWRSRRLRHESERAR